MVEAQNTIVDGRHIRIEQARVNRTLFIHRFSRGTTEQVHDYVRAGGGFALIVVYVTRMHILKYLVLKSCFGVITLGSD